MLLCSLVIICSYKHVSWHSTHSNIMINFSICVLIFRDMIMYLVYPGVYIYIYTHIMIVALAPTGELEGSQLDRSKKYLTYLGDRVPNVPILGLWPSAMGVLSNGTHHAIRNSEGRKWPPLPHKTRAPGIYPAATWTPEARKLMVGKGRVETTQLSTFAVWTY